MIDPLEGVPGIGDDPGYEISSYEDDTHVEITPEDLEEVETILNDVKRGRYGQKWKQELNTIQRHYEKRVEALNKIPGMSDDAPKPKVKDLLNQHDEALDKELKQIFDISNFRHPTEEEISQSIKQKEREERSNDYTESPDPDEIYFRDLSDKKSGIKGIENVVNTFYRDKGLLNEPIVRTTVSKFDIHWKQNQQNFDLWFTCVNKNDTDKDYNITFMPKEVTITYKGEPVVMEMEGKLDVDGCFWSMHELPEEGKIVNVVLRKRSPEYSGTWKHLFRATPNTPTQN
eukprot:XP_001608915.1 hypothetical protein [Babesia bovis T2Bo]